MYRAALLAAAIVAVTTSALAQTPTITIASGAVFDNNQNGGVVACYITNPTSSTATIIKFNIYDQNGSPQFLNTNLCGATLGAHQSCGIGSSLAPNTGNFYSCSATFSGIRIARGSIDIRNLANNALQSLPLN